VTQTSIMLQSTMTILCGCRPTRSNKRHLVLESILAREKTTAALSARVRSCPIRDLTALARTRFNGSIQADRGHKVIDTGPYATARHPGHVGSMLFFVGSALCDRFHDRRGRPSDRT
jgi:hypothetical protein